MRKEKKKKKRDWLKEAIELYQKGEGVFCIWQNCIIYAETHKKEDLIKSEELCLI